VKRNFHRDSVQLLRLSSASPRPTETTGSRPVELPSFKFDGHFVITTTDALSLTVIPGNFVIIGGGVSGLELGTAYARFGSHVTVIEMLDQLLPGVDGELVRVVERNLRRLGVETHVRARAK
jgi:dihydrolipoamide dehydrogenase